MAKSEKIERAVQREQVRADHAAEKSKLLEDALVEGAASGLSPRTIPDIIRDTKAHLGNSG